MNGYKNPPRFLFDTTVLCGAITTSGVNRKLLRLATQTIDYQVVLSRVCLLEFYYNVLDKGIGGVIYPPEMVNDFLDMFVYPILDNYPSVNSHVGRYALDIVSQSEKPIGQALGEISECDTETAIQIAKTYGLEKPLRDFDENDVHVWVAAINEGCQYIVTSNTRRFPQDLGDIKVIRPMEFFNIISD